MKTGVILGHTGRTALVRTKRPSFGDSSERSGAWRPRRLRGRRNANVYQDRADQILGSSITSRLCSFPNVVMTSHQAFFTTEALAQIAQVTLQNAQAYADGTPFVDKSIVC